MSFEVQSPSSRLLSEYQKASKIVDDFCHYENPSSFTTIIQCQQAAALCFRSVCDCYSADSRVWEGNRMWEYLVNGLGSIQAHVSHAANWVDIGLHMREKSDCAFNLLEFTVDEGIIRANKAKRIFESACASYLQTFPRDDVTSWQEIISTKGILTPKEEASLLRRRFLLATYKVALWRFGIKLAQNVQRRYWSKFVVNGPSGEWNMDYRLPDKDKPITMEEGVHAVYRACKVLTTYWPELSRDPMLKDLTPELCCINPQHVNHAFFILSLSERIPRRTGRPSVIPRQRDQTLDLPPQTTAAYRRFTGRVFPVELEPSPPALPSQQEPQMPPPAPLE